MRLLLAALLLLFVYGVSASPAQADPRDVLRDCEVLLARATEPKAGTHKPGDAEVARCRQVVRDWTLRESRMLVDERGKPIR
jgi:hypothetical protein